MSTTARIKKRGFVMTGGGAKGFYEAGVIHAFHLTGMEFDVITGSSIGAINSVAYAEYLYRKRQLAGAQPSDPLALLEAMDPFVKAFHHTWLKMPTLGIIDDGETGPIGRLKNDLVRFNVSLPQLIRLGWWYVDPDHWSLPGPKLWPAFTRLILELGERLGGPAELMRLIKHHPYGPVNTAVRTYLDRFGMLRSLVPPGNDGALAKAFTSPVTPLLPQHLDGDVSAEYDGAAVASALVDPRRTLRDYAEASIAVRLTRANYRTGRLETSTYLTPAEFVRFMLKHAWRLEVAAPESVPLGSFRLQMPGNPNAIAAALASGRFPGVFSPAPISDIYPRADAENDLLYRLMERWLDDPVAADCLGEAFQGLSDGGRDPAAWERLAAAWRASRRMHGFFPLTSDTYVDGGAIDNTPANAAIDAIREWAESEGVSRRDMELELFVIYLHPEPAVDAAETADASLFDAVKRTLEIQGAAKKSSEAVNVDTINTFGERGEDLGRALQVLLAAYRDALERLPAAEREMARERLADALKPLKLRMPGPGDEIIDRVARWAAEVIDAKLPLHVDKVVVYPEEMPLNTLQFTERLGYRKANAIRMLAQGCSNTLFAVRNHLEIAGNVIDDQDRTALELARKWMGGGPWPQEGKEQAKMRHAWHCTRTACSYHAGHCPRGAASRQ